MSKIRAFLKKFGGNGQIKNYSSKTLWVIETTSDPRGYPTAHKLQPKCKSPKKIDSDGFKRVDGKPIKEHKSWWKIWDYTTAKIYDSGSTLAISVIYMRAVPENQFGDKVKYDLGLWGEPIRNIIGVKKNKKGRIEKYYVEEYGWVSKSRAVWLASHDKIDNALAVYPSVGSPYVRSRPDSSVDNNFSAMA